MGKGPMDGSNKASKLFSDVLGRNEYEYGCHYLWTCNILFCLDYSLGDQPFYSEKYCMSKKI